MAAERKTVDPHDLTLTPLTKVTKPFDGATVMLGYWWVIHNECILSYRGFSWQCNKIKSIAEKVGRRCYGEGTEVRFIPVAYVNESDA